MSLGITVKSAANLPNLEWFGQSDPMTVLTYKGIKRTTKVIKSNLNPEWNESFQWPLATAPDHGDAVSIEVFDYEVVGMNKLQGKTSLPMSDFVKKKQSSHVLKLKGAKGEELASCTISLDVVYSAPAVKAKSGNDDDDDAEGTATGGDIGEGDGEGGSALTALDPSSVSASTVEGRKQANRRMAARASLPDKETDFQVRVHVIEGRKLAGVGINPLVKVTCGSEVKGTGSRKGTSSPLFDEMVYFSFKLIPKEMFDTIVEIRVFNSSNRLLLKEALIGSFKFDLGMVFDEPEHCFIHKWLLLTDPDDPSSGAKGYLKFSINVIYPGADPRPSPSTISRENVDIESNLLRPAGVRLQAGTLSIKMYRAEDMPQMDAGLFEGMKKLLNVGKVQKELVDPYCTVQFAGHKGKTKVIRNEQDPEWNQQINLPIRFPSMCERVCFQLKDKDDLNPDDYIGTCFLNLSDISAPGDSGFLPTFGPAFVNIYGSPREFTAIGPDKYEEMNKGKLEGVAYRGRIMVEINMELGKLPTERVEDIKIADQKKLTPFLRRRKYKLYCAFFSATMVKPADEPVEFEVSIGNFGNKLDTNVPAQSSTTPSTNPVRYGKFYHYLPWMDQKPCVVIDSHWEENCYRIESMNLLNFIADELEECILAVKKMQAKEQYDYDHNEAREILLRAIEIMADTIREHIPRLPEKGFTLLDKQRRKAREEELRLLLGESHQILTDSELTMKPVLEAAEEYLSRLRFMAVETQNSVPDVIIWMLSGKKRVASYRIASQHLMYSRGTKTRGKLCGKLQEIQLKPSAVNEEADERKMGALLRVLLWFGLEQDQNEWTREQPRGEVAVFAETYENEVFFVNSWGDKLIMTRPNWSDGRGKVKQERKMFDPPSGWDWDGPWLIKPESSSEFDADSVLDEVAEEVYEHHVRESMSSWSSDSSAVVWCNSEGQPLYDIVNKEKISITKDDITPPDNWAWVSNWQQDTARACDDDGFEYSSEQGVWQSFEKATHTTRRCRWVRIRRKILDEAANAKQQALRKKRLEEGWEYAVTHGSSYHAIERKMVDMARRRRWLRKLVTLKDTETIKPAIFYFKSEKQQKEDDETDGKRKGFQQAPRLFLTFQPNDCHKYQLWVYLYQARDMFASDKSGLSDPYAIVSFDHNSIRSRVCKESVCPTWNQTLIIDTIRLYGDPDTILRSPPPIILEFFDKDAIGEDEFLGMVKTTPTVQLPDGVTPVRLAWYEIKRYGKPAGEVLTAFELFLDDAEVGAKIPLPPSIPPGEKHFIVPSGIRPELQKTRIEVLCWGVRNMKRYNLLQVTSPLVELQCGRQTLRTKHIPNTKINPNFPEPVVSMDVMVPKEIEYAPPFIIRVLDKRSFGRLPMVGVNIIKSLEHFRVDPVPEASLLMRRKTTLRFKDGPKRKESPVVLEDPNDILDMDPDNESISSFDWWSKYYYSIGDKSRTEEDYVAKCHDKMTIYKGELEDAFNDFSDLTKTFPLYRGKGARDPDDSEGNVVGLFKGAIKVYPLPEDGSSNPPPILSKIPSTEPVDVVVRVYIIKGTELQPMDPGGKSDPYVQIKVGNKQISDKKNYIANSLDPLFGRMFELPAKLPIESMLTITVMDYDHLSADDLIGETKIDLENRFFSQHRPTCGLPATFAKRGSNKWRDHELPKDILNWYCRSQNIRDPRWVSDYEVIVNGTTHELDRDFKKKSDRKDFGDDDQQLALKVLHKLELVPEHVEIRTLYNPMQPTISQGKLHMWVDIFPKSNNLPTPVDITPRKPEPYALRIVIWNTSDVKLDERSPLTGEQMSDIYVKSWLRGQDDTQKTDVHYRSMDGSGNFNWRFVFHFDYLASEQMMVISKREHFYSLDKTVQYLPPRLTLQVWDNDLFSPDDFIGTIDIDLLHIPEAAKSSSECGAHQLDPKKDKKAVNLFNKKRIKGWWPVFEKADSDEPPTGKVEMELEIVTLEEEQLRPAGMAREEPNINPKLDPPNRPSTSFLWFTSPWRTFKFIIWKNFKWHIILSIVAVFVLLMTAVFIYSAPNFLAKFFIERILPF